MSKRPIDFTTMDDESLMIMENFVNTRIEIAKEDQRHKAENNALKKRLESVYENRENDIVAGLPKSEVYLKYPTDEIEKEIKAEEKKHKNIMKPLNENLKSTYCFVPDGTYDAYVRKVELGKRGNFLESLLEFLNILGITEVSQSALGKLAELITDRIGVGISNSKQVLEDGIFSSTLKERQFNKLFMSIFCDILVQNNVIELES